MEDPALTGWILDEESYRRTVEWARALRFYFRPSFEGFEVFRRPGGLLVAANHGLFAMEAPSLLLGVWDASGRAIRGLGDRVLYATELQRKILGPTGGVEGTPENAHLLLTRGEICYVCPGGAREALASAKDRYKLFWEGHDGFLRCANRAGAPIVPMAVIGIDEIYRQVLDAQAVRDTHLGVAIRALLGEKYVVPLYVGLGPLPLPMKLRFLAGEPIEVPADPSKAEDPAVVAELHAKTVAAVEALIAKGLADREREDRGLEPGLERLVTRLSRLIAG